MEDTNQKIGYFDRDGDASDIHDHAPDQKWGEAARLVVCLAVVVDGEVAGRIEVTTKKSELPSFLKKFDSRFRSKSELPMTYQEFSDHLSQKCPNGPEKAVSPDSKNL
jgi:hypothetical protein